LGGICFWRNSQATTRYLTPPRCCRSSPTLGTIRVMTSSWRYEWMPPRRGKLKRQRNDWNASTKSPGWRYDTSRCGRQTVLTATACPPLLSNQAIWFGLTEETDELHARAGSWKINTTDCIASSEPLGSMPKSWIYRQQSRNTEHSQFRSCMQQLRTRCPAK